VEVGVAASSAVGVGLVGGAAVEQAASSAAARRRMSSSRFMMAKRPGEIITEPARRSGEG
jgi:F0F1-type ATP synthase membrane subunit c/vacuolar-type H+-ATPase subunit K